MSRTLSVYFARFFIGQFVRYALGVTLLIYLIDFIEFTRRAAGLAAFSVPGALAISALRIPGLLETYAQFIVLIAAIASLLTLNKQSELVIARASGLSAWQFIAPVCAAAFLLGIASILVLNPLVAKTMTLVETQEVEWGLSAARNGNETPFLRQPNSDGGITIIAATGSAQGGTLLAQPTFTEIGEDGSILRRIDGERANLADGFWTVRNTTTFVDGDAVARDEVLRIPSTLSPDVLRERLTEAQSIAFYDLPSRIAAAEAFGLPVGPYRMQWHAILATPAVMLSMVIIAATVSLRFARFGQSSMAILGGIAAGFLLYVLSTLFQAFGSSEIVSPVIAAWLPVIVAMFFGSTFLLYREDG